MVDLAFEVKVEAPASFVDQAKHCVLARIAAAIAVSVRKADDAVTSGRKIDLHAVRRRDRAIGRPHWARDRGVERELGRPVSADINQALQLGNCEARVVEVIKEKIKPAVAVEVFVDLDGY